MQGRNWGKSEALTFFSKYIETTDQLSKEVGEDNPGLNVFDYSVRVTGKSRQEDKPKDLAHLSKQQIDQNK